MAKLEISLGNKGFNDAKILNNINDLICRSQLRKDYSIILAYDGVSNYFCNKGYCLISEFERKLRELIYIILIKTFGIEWYEKTVSNDLKNKIKEISKGKNNAVLIESALQEMTVNDLENYLFEPYYETQIYTIIKSKEDIADFLEEFIPESLWERFFENKIENIHNEVNQIREFRNIIYHNKQFYLQNYNEFYNVIKPTLSKIQSATYALNKKDIDNKFKLESNIAYSQLYKKLLSGQVSGVQEMMKQEAKIQEVLRNPAM